MNQLISCKGCSEMRIKQVGSSLCVECHRKRKAHQVQKSKKKIKENGPIELRVAEKRRASLEELSNRFLSIKWI
jgi:hypothetical protein